MLHLKFAALVAFGGAFGSAARYLSNAAAMHVLGGAFPYGTLFVNVFGSFLMGVVTGLATHRSMFSPEVRLLLTSGFLGGFTTFSAFALDTAFLAGRSAPFAAVYVGASVGISIAALYFGMALAK